MTNKSVGYKGACVIDCSAAEELKHDLAVPFLTGKFHKKDKRYSVFSLLGKGQLRFSSPTCALKV